ncbi:hypothetical protein [Accumulibacter sp.]|uniref:hypothetical protein n=1 Tax=Accumulibacter sp. TaxID=2053492 RepID=UPI002638DBFB|nr:hypothetical protein [Accumulibacter sp.]
MKNVILILLLSFSSLANAGAKELSPEMKQLLGISSLPKDAQPIGTWLGTCARSIEFSKAKNTYFMTDRCSDGSGGKDGNELSKFSKGGLQAFRKKEGSSHGDHYVIEKDGRLGVYDKDGLIEKLPQHSKLWP